MSTDILPDVITFMEFADNRGMTELTVKMMSDSLKLLPVTVKKRLQKHKIKPVGYVGITAIYDPSAIEVIKTSKSAGRPKKNKPNDQP
jgi:hypothetical protein